jgi:hypothetical protein
MFICAAGDIHGAMDRLYDDVFAFEALLGIRFDYVLHVGDFGIWLIIPAHGGRRFQSIVDSDSI